MRLKNISLALQFILFISALVLVTSLVLSSLFVAHHVASWDEQIRQKGIALVRGFAHNSELGVLTRNTEMLRELSVGLFQEADVISVAVVDAEGNPLLEEQRVDSDEAPLFALTDVSTRQVGAALVRIAPFAEQSGSGQTKAYEISHPVFTERGTRRNEEIGFMLEESEFADRRLEIVGTARVMLSLSRSYQNLYDLKWAIGLLTFVVIVVSILLTVMLVRKMVAPLQALAEATRRIASGSLDETVPERSTGEIGQLARSFNQMVSDLSRSRKDLERYSADLEGQVLKRTKDLEQAQVQLVQAEKMSAVGLLVSGVAHELNNPLAGVVGYAQLLLKSGADEKVQRGLEKINKEAERCKKIVQNLQTFARKHKPEKNHIGINGILESTLELRSYQLKVDNISVDTDLDPDLPKTMADFHQLQQVFLNIIINAHHAMTAHNIDGRLMIRSRRKDDLIVVEIEDNGPGIQQENIGRLFDPFFTTKEVGQGTGLGLSICYGIIEEHRGRISARNGAAGGAIFVVELPVTDPDATREPLAGVSKDEQEDDPDRKNILVVDDELPILDILYQVLKMDGHRVDTALNGAVALKKIQKEEYDVIISDVKMPGVDGLELYKRVSELNPDLARRIIFSTGDLASSETRAFLEESGNSFLQKPFGIDAIRKIVRSVLLTTAQ